MKYFGDLHSHSDFSIFDGFAKLDDKIARAKELGYQALAMTEHGTTTGLMEFYLKCKKEGIIPVLGYEGYFSYEPTVKGNPTYHILLLAKNLEGYRNILSIASYGSKYFYRKPIIGLDCLKEFHEGVICSTACIAGILNTENHAYIIDEMRNIFGEDFYFEIQPHDFPEQHEYNKKVMALSKEYGIKTIITGDSHYVLPEECETHRQWLNLGEDSEYYSSADYHMMSKDEMVAKLPYLDLTECFDNVSEVIEKCKDLEIPLGGHNYPVFDTDNADEYIRVQCRKGWVNKGVNKLPNKDVYGKQVLHELDVLEKCGYKNYVCIIHDMLNWCKEHDIPIGVGRGSVGGSTIAYLMDITDVDPIKYNLIFERFANPERVTDCDVDVDVASSSREEVIEYVRRKYGEVYQIRTINYISDKSAVQRAGQVLGIEPAKLNNISKNINTLDELEDGVLKELAKKFYGHIVNYGKHASAVVVFPKAVTNWCAIEKQGDAMVAAQDYHLLEKQGIMKLDILGLETLDIIDNTVMRIKEDGIDLDLSKIDMSDKKTGDMLRAGLTDGCFQIESKTMTEIIQAIKTKSVHDLIDTVAIGRPGVLNMGMDKTFEKRRNGEEEVTYLHPKLEPILRDTEGVILYQEQIMQIAQALCGFSYGKADNLRRIIGRKIVEEMQPAIDEMIEAGVANGIDRDSMKNITDLIITFAEYGFNRGHSAAYGITAWRTAYLKAHYPAQFMCALMDSVANDKAKLATYIAHCKKLGLEVLPPDIRLSRQWCTHHKNQIRLGFNCISGVGNTPILNAVNGRLAIELTHDIYNKTVWKNLIKAGAFDHATDCSRYELLELVDWAKDKRKSKGEFKYSGETGPTYGEMEFSVMGYSFTDVFKDYDSSMERDNVKLAVIANVKAHKTRKGKPMAFVKTITKDGVKELVIFDKDFSKLEKGVVYWLKLDGTIIKDFVVAKKKRS